jgi:hypothetical protein
MLETNALEPFTGQADDPAPTLEKPVAEDPAKLAALFPLQPEQIGESGTGVRLSLPGLLVLVAVIGLSASLLGPRLAAALAAL